MKQQDLFTVLVHEHEKDAHGQAILDANRKKLGGQSAVLLERLLEDGSIIYEDLKRNHGVGYPNSRHSDVRAYFINIGFDWDSMITKEIVNYHGTNCTKITIHDHSRQIIKMFLRSLK